MNLEPVAETELELLCGELSESEPRELWASELLEAGLMALIDAELTASVPAALLAAELMDAGVTALVASELFDAELAAFRATVGDTADRDPPSKTLAVVRAREARPPSRAPRRG